MFNREALRPKIPAILHNLILIPGYLAFFILLHSCKKDPIISSPPPPVTEFDDFQKIMGHGGDEYTYDATLKADGNLLIAGTTNSIGNGGFDGYLILADKQGEMIKETTYGMSGDEGFYAITKTHDGNYFLAGYRDSLTQGNSNVYLVKVTADGSQLASSIIPSSQKEEASDIIRTPDGNFMVLGRSENNGNIDILLMKVNSQGKLLWKKIFGGGQTDAGTQLIPTPDGNYFLYCYTYSYGAGNRDILLMEVNEDGDSLQTFTYGSPVYEQSGAIISNPLGGYYMAGHSNEEEPNHQVHLMEITNSGTLINEVDHGGPFHEGAEDLLLDNKGNIIVLANTMKNPDKKEEVYLLRFSRDGKFIAEKTMGTEFNDKGHTLLQSGNAFLIVGNTFADGNSDVILIRSAI